MNIKKIYWDIFFSFLIAISMLFIGLIISFIITKLIPPYSGIIWLNEQYKDDQPLIIQFFRYITDFFTGNWGISLEVEPGAEVRDFIFKEKLPSMIELLTISVTIGLPIGILLGKISVEHKETWTDKAIRILAIIGISLPVFWLGLIFQFLFTIQLDWLPGIGFESGSWKYYIMPVSILIIAISSLITLQTISVLESESFERSIISNTVLVSKNFGFIIMFYILTELTFDILGIGECIKDGFENHDIFILSGCLFVLILILVIVTFSANIIFSLYSYQILKSNEKSETYNNANAEREAYVDINSQERIQNYLLQRLKSPFIIIGTILVTFTILVALFPQILTPYTLDEIWDFYPNPGNPDQLPWMKPSKDHPLGTTRFGRDLLAVISWGIRDILIVGFGATLIGLIGGSICGFIAGRFNIKLYNAIMGVMTIPFIIPTLILFLIIPWIFESKFWYLLMISIIGIFLIPNFTRVISKAILKKHDLKKICRIAICYIPLNVAIAILIWVSITMVEPVLNTPNVYILPWLSYYIIDARGQLFSGNLWFVFWPGFIIFIIILGFFFLHEGLKDLIR